MLEIDDCEFVAAMVAAGIPTPVAEIAKKWAEQEETDDELRHHQDRS